MTLKGMYNDIAAHYEIADKFGSISMSHQMAIEQIKTHCTYLPQAPRVLDLGVGDASFLEKLLPLMPGATLTGIDLSSKMLEHAKERLNIHTIEGSATDAEHFLPMHSQDVVLAHFINAYIPIHTLFEQARKMTHANGYFSMITTTYDSFPNAQQQLAEFIAKDSMLSSVVGHYYKNIVKNTTVAASEDELMAKFDEYKFTVLDHQRIEVPIQLDNIDDLARFGIEGTWFLNTLSIRMLPKNFILNRMKKLFKEIFSFPYHDKHIIDVVLAKK